MKKYYVWNDKVQILVLAWDEHDAVSQALSYMGFKQSVDIPEHLISWDFFAVDCMGFKHIDGVKLPIINSDLTTSGVTETVFPMYLVEKYRALEKFDHVNSRYDPFCESHDDYFDGYDDNYADGEEWNYD